MRDGEGMHALSWTDELEDHGPSLARAAAQRGQQRDEEIRALSGLRSGLKSGSWFDPVLSPAERDELRRERDEPGHDTAPTPQGGCFQTGTDVQFENTRSLDTEALQDKAQESSSTASSVFKLGETQLRWKNRPRANTAILAVAARMLFAPEGITTKQLADSAGVTRPTARRWLDYLVEQGLAHREGITANRRYFSERGRRPL